MSWGDAICISAERPGDACRSDATRTDLIAKIRSLESFNWSVSHDLRDVLGAIAGGARLASSAVQTADIPRALRLLDSIDRQSNSAIDLLASLLALSMAGTDAIERVPVPLDALVRECWQQVRSQGIRRNVPALDVQGSLPTVHADPRLLRQVWLNLLQNAVKFTQPVQDPVIEVGCIRGCRNVFFVRDNGVGLDSEAAGQLFKPFTRLHRDQFDGTGLGLAIVKRIVQGHGGDIRVESARGRGACFLFTLEGGAER